MINLETLKREKMLFAYTSALEQGDFARLAAILEAASGDAVLERQILEINTALSQPRPGASARSASKILPVKLWRQIKTSAAGLFSLRIRNWPALRNIALGVGAFAIILLGALALLGPSIGKEFSNVVTALPKSLPPVTASATQMASGNRISTAGSSAYPSPITSQPSSPQPGTQPADRLVVRDGSLTVVTHDTRQARQAVMDMVAEFASEGAFVVSSYESNPTNDQLPVINMVLRVPVNRFDESMTRLASLGIQVLNRTETAQDVTQDYVDTTARIEALETSRARLLEIIKEAKNTDDLLRAEQELSRREADLEAAKARQQYLATTAALSSISVELRPAITSQPVTENSWDPAATLHNAVSVLLANLRSLADGTIYFVITILPWLVVTGLLIYGGVRLLLRKRKK